MGDTIPEAPLQKPGTAALIGGYPGLGGKTLNHFYQSQ